MSAKPLPGLGLIGALSSVLLLVLLSSAESLVEDIEWLRFGATGVVVGCKYSSSA